MMGPKREIKIHVPNSTVPRIVSIQMSLLSSETERYTFNVKLLDKTAERMIADVASGTTHDLRGLILLAIELIQNGQSPEAVEALYQALALCGHTYADFLSENVRLQAQTTVTFQQLVFIHERIQQFIAQQVTLYNKKIAITYIPPRQEDDLNLALTSQQLDAIERFFMNLFKNSLEAGAHNIMVTYCSQFESNAKKVTFTAEDDGPGIPKHLLGDFFNRAKPCKKQSPDHKKTLAEITQNRGEGILIAHDGITALGGENQVVNKVPPQTGAVFTTRFCVNDLLAPLNAAKKCPQIILLIDDSLIALKMLLKATFNHLQQAHVKQSNLYFQTQESWKKSYTLTLDVIGETAIICASSAEMGYLIAQRFPVNLLVTDDQMPNGMSGFDLALQARSLETALRPYMSIALHTGNSREHLEREKREALEINNITLLLKGNHDEVQLFFSEKLASRPGAANSCSTSPFLHEKASL